MSVRRIQTERVLEGVTRTLHASGVRPLLNDILSKVSRHFSQFPAGLPLPIPDGIATVEQRSDVRRLNQALVRLAENLDVLYEASLEHVDDILVLSAALQGHLERLRARQRRIEAKVDDYLLSLYNTDGYYYAISDTFSDLELTDVALTSAHVDTAAGQVVIPSIGAFTKRVSRGSVGAPVITATADGRTVPVREIAPFSGAVEDGLDNEIWAIEVETMSATEVVVTLLIPLGLGGELVELSRLDFIPYGVTPIQVFVETVPPVRAGESAQGTFQGFGNRIATGTTKMVFADQLRSVAAVRLTLRKTLPDYTHTDDGVTRYRYLFGAREVVFLHQVYDNDARFVSERLSLPDDLSEELVIDAVSLVADDEVPPDTSLVYWVASDPGDPITEIDGLTWRRIQPLGSQATEATTVVRFDGATPQRRIIRANAQLPDIPLIPMDLGAADPRRQNPSPAIIPGVDIWRLCAFEEPVLPASVRLEEGVNTVRIAYVPRDSEATDSLSFWAEPLRDPDTRVAYGRIDVGNDFLYGGDVGEADVSLFAETYIESQAENPTFLAECSKPDPNSQAWKIRVFLNGREIGYLPVGTHRALLPWTLRQGLNHIVVLADVPPGRSTGTIDLFGTTKLYEYGTVKLATWSYVSLFDLSYNTAGDPPTFTFHDGELISRRRPTDNFRLTWSKATGKGPTGIRLRADLSRDVNNPTVSPRISSYRLRFAFGEEGG